MFNETGDRITDRFAGWLTSRYRAALDAPRPRSAEFLLRRYKLAERELDSVELDPAS